MSSSILSHFGRYSVVTISGVTGDQFIAISDEHRTIRGLYSCMDDAMQAAELPPHRPATRLEYFVYNLGNQHLATIECDSSRPRAYSLAPRVGRISGKDSMEFQTLARAAEYFYLRSPQRLDVHGPSQDDDDDDDVVPIKKSSLRTSVPSPISEERNLALKLKYELESVLRDFAISSKERVFLDAVCRIFQNRLPPPLNDSEKAELKKDQPLRLEIAKSVAPLLRSYSKDALLDKADALYQFVKNGKVR